MKRSVIIGSGSILPTETKRNQDFLSQDFYTEDQLPVKQPKEVVVGKFEAITGTSERRYAPQNLNASDLAIEAGEKAIQDSGIDRETLDMLIVAHNFGDVSGNQHQSDQVPALASRVKGGLGIVQPSCMAFDVLFGCPGWIMAMMQAEAFFKAGMAKRALVIGAETLSRVYDRFDRDSMIFSDGAGAVVMEAVEGSEAGILSCSAVSHCQEDLHYLFMGCSNRPDDGNDGTKFLKMKGRKVYEYALKQVPLAMKDCMDKSGVPVSAIKKIFIHQANEKMDEAILDAFYKLYDLQPPVDVMPMNIQFLGNSSVATIPTLFDMVSKCHYPQHRLASGDIILFASVGAGMNINAVCYRCP